MSQERGQSPDQDVTKEGLPDTDLRIPMELDQPHTESSNDLDEDFDVSMDDTGSEDNDDGEHDIEDDDYNENNYDEEADEDYVDEAPDNNEHRLRSMPSEPDPEEAQRFYQWRLLQEQQLRSCFSEQRT